MYLMTTFFGTHCSLNLDASKFRNGQASAGIQEKKPFSQVGGYNFSSQKLKGR